MTVGYYAPLPPAPTGVADYAAALLDALRKLGRVEVNVPGDIALYQLGNNHLHREIYQQALEHPGVIVLHDAVLHHFFLGTLGEAGYIEEFVYNYGEWTRGLAVELWNQRARSAADARYFEYPMLKRIATVSRAVIVHNRAAASVVERHAPHAKIVEIPHLFVAPKLPSEDQVARFRSSLGLDPQTLLAGVFGHLRESKRLPVVIRAVERARSQGANIRLLIAGAFASSDLERALTPLFTNPAILRVGHLPEIDFWRYGAATDVCINLRYPSAGEASGIAIRMMGIGKPVIFTAGEEIGGIPENACLRVDLGAAEEEMLSNILQWLSANRETAAEIGRRAAHHITREHAIEKVAERYWQILSENWGQTNLPPP